MFNFTFNDIKLRKSKKVMNIKDIEPLHDGPETKIGGGNSNPFEVMFF
jgi:hypothetical protein